MNRNFRRHAAAAVLVILPLTGALAAPASPARRAAALGAGREDHRPPVVRPMTPGNGDRITEHGNTLIRAKLDDGGSGIEPRSVRLIVDGLDVTADARVGGGEIGYRERLGRGTHRAEVVVRDRAGNQTRTGWTFRVV